MVQHEQIEIFVNGSRRAVEAGVSVAELLQRLNIPQPGTAVELDGQLLSPRDFGTVTLRQGQRLEIVRLVGGG